MTFICAVWVQRRAMQLRIQRDEVGDVWRWSVVILDGATLNQGVTTTRVAAQVASQRAFETRLHWSGLNRWIVDKYQWKQLLS
jgi:hypothetical protein